MYQTAETRRAGLDNMVWQAPALSIAAQAFLLIIAYTAGNTWTARALAAALGGLTALATFQLLVRHRRHEFTHQLWLERFEEARGWPVLHNTSTIENDIGGERPSDQYGPLVHNITVRLAGKTSTTFWVGLLWVFSSPT